GRLDSTTKGASTSPPIRSGSVDKRKGHGPERARPVPFTPHRYSVVTGHAEETCRSPHPPARPNPQAHHPPHATSASSGSRNSCYGPGAPANTARQTPTPGLATTAAQPPGFHA